MAINFTKAIELQVVRKLKSHAKVGYQDHPNGDRQCSGCSMFVEGSQPSCTHVAPPIAAHGYCDDFERIDPNARARATIGKSFAEVMKDGPPDESRDNSGKWTAGGGDPSSNRARSDAKQMAAAKQNVKDLQRQLSNHPQNQSEDVYWGVHRMLQQARDDLANLKDHIAQKAFNPDEPRDEKGMWTAGDSPGHPDWMHGEQGAVLAAGMEDVSQGIHDSADHIEEMRQALDDVSQSADDHSLEEDDHTPGTKEYAAWEKQNNINLNDVADKTMALHQALVDHMDATAGVLTQLRGRIGALSAENGTRMGKSMAVGDVHAATALGNQPPNKRKAKDFLTTIGEVKGGARVVGVPAMEKAGPDDEARDDHGRWTSGGGGGDVQPHITSFSTKGEAVAHARSMRERGMKAVIHRVEQQVTGASRGAYASQIGGGGGSSSTHVTFRVTVTKSGAMDFGKALGKIKADALAGAATVDFATALAESTWSKIDFAKGRTVNALFMRHGPTKFNNQTDMSKDRVRSWNNVPLTKEGIEDAEKAGEKLKDEGIGYIVSSDLGRAVQTSKLVGKAVGIKPVHDYGMRPWKLGKFTGMTTEDAHDGIMHHVENPDEVVDDGESFNTFKARAAQTMLSHIKKAGKKKMLVVSHHRNERLFASMRPDGTVDAKKFMKSGEDPGDFTEMEFDTGELENAIRSAEEGAGETGVGKVWGSNAELPDAVRSALPSEAQTVWRKVANDRIKAGQTDKSAIRQAWTAVKNGWSKTKGGAWVRKTWLGPDGVHEFLEAELAKLGGETSIAKPTDNVNVSLQLTPLDDQNARSPFPYDQYFFANLRNDQKERVLAALTDQDSLPERDIPLSSLSAVQDRVDPGKIQSMLEGAPEKYPVVIRTGPGRYCIVDGHHRLTAALLSGVKMVHVKYLDVEAFDPRVHTDDNPGSAGEPVSKVLARGIKFDVRKTDEDQQLVFGWASIASIDGVVVVDKQDDIIPEDELEKAAYDFALYCRQQGDMHERMGVGRLVESMMFTKQKQDAMGIDLGLVGWWVGFKVDDPGVWARIKSGNLPEFSIGGKARRETVDA